MTEPSSMKPVFTANAGLQAGYTALGCDKVVVLGPRAGIKLENNGFHAGADIGIGTAATAGVEVGKDFDINKNWGLDLSAKAETAVSMLDKNHASITHHYEIEGQEPVNFTVNESWRAGVTTAGIKAMANYTTDNGKFQIGAGVSGQYATNHAKGISLLSKAELSENSTMYRIEALNPRKQGYVVSPEVTASYKANKNLTFEAKGNTFGGGVTARWTF